jgi:hypothetical protein
MSEQGMFEPSRVAVHTEPLNNPCGGDEMKYEVHFANGSRVHTTTLTDARKAAADAAASDLPALIWLRDARLVGDARLIEVLRATEHQT